MKNDYSCTVCQITFVKKRDLRKHSETTSHITKDNLSKAGTQDDADYKDFICDICLREFKLKSSMLRHRKYHFNVPETEEENKYHDTTNSSSVDCKVEDNGEPDNSVILTHDNEGGKDEIDYDSKSVGSYSQGKDINAASTSADDGIAEENMNDQNDNEDENINDIGVSEEPFEPNQITYVRNDSEEGGYEIKCAIM